MFPGAQDYVIHYEYRLGQGGTAGLFRQYAQAVSHFPVKTAFGANCCPETEHGDDASLDFAGSFVYGQNFNVPLDLFHLVLPNITITPKGLNPIIGHGIARFGGEILGNGPLYLEIFFVGIKSSGNLLYVCPGRLQLHSMGDQKPVGVSLFLREGCAKLYPLLGVPDRLF